MSNRIAALLLLSVGLTAPATAANRSFPVPDFSKLRVEGPFTVRVHTGGAASVKATGPAARLEKLTVEARGGTVVVSTEKSWGWRSLSWGRGDTVQVDITVPMLQAAELSGPGDLIIDRIRTTAFAAALSGPGNLIINRIETSRLRADLTGPGDLTIIGKSDRADMSVMGPGDLRGGGLAVGLLTASVAGPGTLSVGPTRVARANLTGPGDIVIAGRPRCTVNKTGPGTVKCGG